MIYEDSYKEAKDREYYKKNLNIKKIQRKDPR